MKDKQLNINELVVIEQLPQIFYQLEVVGEVIDKELEKVKELKATEENKQEVKKIRTGINNTLKEFEDKRKEIKNKILEDYNLFNEKYENEVKIKLQNASNDLKNKIDEIENEQLKEKQNEIYSFIEEHLTANHLNDILDVGAIVYYANLKINISTSVKSLKEDSLLFIEKVSTEVKLIELEEKYSDEILLEYQKNGFDYTKAKLDVINKHRQLEELAKKREEVQEIVEEEEKVVEVVEEIVAPKEIIEDEEELICSFTIKTTKEKIIMLKKFMKENNILEYKESE
jgi:hypothetical protein